MCRWTFPRSSISLNFEFFQFQPFYAQISWNFAKLGDKNLSTLTIFVKNQLNCTCVSCKYLLRCSRSWYLRFVNFNPFRSTFLISFFPYFGKKLSSPSVFVIASLHLTLMCIWTFRLSSRSQNTLLHPYLWKFGLF